MSAIVEQALGRDVEAVLGGIEVEADIASHVFILQRGET